MRSTTEPCFKLHLTPRHDSESGILKEEDLLQSGKQKIHSSDTFKSSLGNSVIRAFIPWDAYSLLFPSSLIFASPEHNVRSFSIQGNEENLASHICIVGKGRHLNNLLELHVQCTPSPNCYPLLFSWH
ncbi:uncharacterized protein AAEQ78_021181 isoform 1-T1 [Lycaon pictus]